ncbi:hypothetical protein F5Y02DRAFT_399140 [Annulohypoxylon stygium]|nr:hypothetical protein F5Y02DRAFT_399140 [Annulohypoxylon stygium]
MSPTRKARARTPDSVVWGTTKARNLHSGVRFSWDKYQKLYFVDFLETVGLGFKNADITPLLIQLNLDGYEEIENYYGANVHQLIEVKVRRKIKSMADELGEEKLKKVSFGLKISGPTPKTEPVVASKTAASSQPETPQTKTTMRAPTRTQFDFNFQGKESKSSQSPTDKSNTTQRDKASSTITQSLRASHPFLKMPKPKAPMTPNVPSSLSSLSRSNSSSSPRRNFSFEPKVAPTYSFKAPESSSSDQSTPPKMVKSEISESSAPSYEFRTPASTIRRSTSSTPSVADSVVTDEISSAQLSRAKRSIGRLITLLKRTESALDEVEFAFDDLPDVEGGRDLAKTISRLRSEFNGLQIDAEEVDDFAKTNLKG